MKFNPKPFENRLKQYLARQAKIIEDLINSSSDEVVRRTTQVNAPSDRDFFFRDYPALSKTVDNIMRRLSRSLTEVIQSGIEWSWDLANTKNDDMVSRLLRSIGIGRVPPDAVERWNQKNLPALAAFEKRRIAGMKLSDKVWAYTKGIKGDLELALDLGIGEGMSADRLSRSVRQYLNEPDRLYRRVRDEKGILRLSKSASNYHPGQGVYRSSYKNAKRLALNETNMAYRTADHERVQQIDFILGIEVHLSKNHTCLDSKGVPRPFHDICDELQGRYPKWFKFTGWHPNCRCYVTTILPDQKEFIKYLAAMDEDGNSTYQLTGEITELPPGYTEWVENNADRIQRAEERGTLPYFLRDNPQTWEDIVNKPMSAEDELNAIKQEWRARTVDLEDYEKSSARKFDFLGFKKEVESLLGSPVSGRIGMSGPDNWYFTLNGQGFSLERDFRKNSKGELVCSHEFFHLEKELQGKGLSKALFNSLYTQYKNVGVTLLEVHANIDVGGYTWARYGFSATSRAVAEKAVTYWGARGDVALANEALLLIDHYYSDNLLHSSDPFPMNLLTPKYKKLLLGSDWEGVLDFRNKEQLAVWESYLKR